MEGRQEYWVWKIKEWKALICYYHVNIKCDSSILSLCSFIYDIRLRTSLRIENVCDNAS